MLKYVSTCVCVYVYVCACMHVCVYAMHVCMCSNMRACVRVCVHVGFFSSSYFPCRNTVYNKYTFQ